MHTDTLDGLAASQVLAQDEDAEVSRPDWIKLRFTDIKGKEQQIKAEGLLAACIQHEIDHLNGILFIDHISKLKRDIIWRKVLKEARQT